MRAVLVRGLTAVIVLTTVFAGLALPIAAADAATGPAATGLAYVGATDPATGFPRWYEDSNGVRLEPCVDSFGFCAPGSTLPNPNAPAEVPGNFPSETFYYDATSTITLGGNKATLTMAVEAAFGNVNGDVVDHEQITFSRIQVKVTGGLVPGATYTITSPYGVDVVQADATGAIKPPKTPASRYERGCGAAPPDCDFGLLLSGRVGPFLTNADPTFTPPSGYLGDGATAHTVTGSPFDTNYFSIAGPGVGTARSDLFTLVGKVAGPLQVSPSAVRFPGTDVATAATTQHVSVTNVGAQPLTISTAATVAGGAFHGGLGACNGVVLTRDQSCAVDVDFTPGVVGDQSDTLDLQASVPGGGVVAETAVPVRGLGRTAGTTPSGAVAPSDLAFGTTQVGAVSPPQTVTLTNAGSAPLSVLGVTLAGAHPREYQLDRRNCPAVLDSGSCTIAVRFAPHHGGDLPATLVVDDDAPGAPRSVALTGTGRAGLVATSTLVDPATGFPRWYEDSAGVRLQPCVQSTAYCPALSTVPNPSAAPAVPTNFPKEGFYFLAQSTLNVPSTTGKTEKAVYVAAVEAAFGNIGGVVTPGEQITFSRIQVKVTGGLKPNATYTIINPYGVEHITADATGAIKPPGTLNSRYEVGCGVVPPACDFGVLLTGRIGPWLQQDTSDGSQPPQGFIGDGTIAHKVTGSPFGTNVFELKGPNPAGGPDLDLVQPLFTLNGMLSYGPSTPDLAEVSDTGSSASDDVTNATSLTFTGGAQPRVPVTLYVDGAPVETQTSADDGAYSLTARDVSPGVHQVTATETVDGVESHPSAARAVTVDLTAPTAASISSTAPVSPSSSTTPYVLGFAEADATVDVYGAAGCTGPALGSGTGARFGIGITATVGANSTTPLFVRQTDLAGNAGPCSGTPVSYVHDNVPPAAPGISASFTGATTTQATVSFTLTDSEPAQYQCKLDGSAFAACASPATYPSLAEGAHTFAARAVDAAGNPSPVTTRTFTVDTTGPTAAMADATTAFATDHPLFAFRLSEPGTATCALEPVRPAFAACSSPADFGTLANGTYTLRIRATDAFGNVGPVASVPVTVDTVAPPVAISAGPTAPTANPTPTFTFGSADPAATFACGVAPESAGTPPLTPCTSPATTPALPTGRFRFFVRSTDPAGNATLTSRLFVIDQAAPAAPRALVATGASRSTITLRWNAVGDLTKVVYRVFRDGAAVPRAVVSGTTWQDSGLRAGTAHTYRVVAVDAAGNASVASAAARAATAGDTTAPRISARPRIVVGGHQNGRVAVTVRWGAADAGGVASYELWQRSGTGAWHAVRLPHPSASSVRLLLAPGGRYTFQVRATDLAGHRSARVAGAPTTVR